MYTRRPCLGLLLAAGVLAGQERVTAAVKQPLTADDLAKMPRASVKTASNGMQTVYEGVWLHEVLKRAGAPQGETLREKRSRDMCLAEAPDGYQAGFSLG